MATATKQAPAATPAVTPDLIGEAGAQLVAAINGGVIPESDRKAIAASIAARTLQAQTADDILDEGGLLAAADVLGVALRVDGYALRKSEIEDDGALPVYAVADCVRMDTGEMVAVAFGSVKILSQLAAFRDRDLFPIAAVEVYEMGKGRKGENAPLGLRRYQG